LKISIRCLLAGTALSVLFVFTGTTARAQQTYVSRYDVYAGFADIDSPMLGLNEHGFHLQAGMNMRTWLSVGADYSEGTGSQILTPNLLPTATQTTIDNEIIYLKSVNQLPATYQLAVPATAATQTFASGRSLPTGATRRSRSSSGRRWERCASALCRTRTQPILLNRGS